MIWKIKFYALFIIGAMVAVISPPIDVVKRVFYDDQIDLLAGELGYKLFGTEEECSKSCMAACHLIQLISFDPYDNGKLLFLCMEMKPFEPESSIIDWIGDFGLLEWILVAAIVLFLIAILVLCFGRHFTTEDALGVAIRFSPEEARQDEDVEAVHRVLLQHKQNLHIRTKPTPSGQNGAGSTVANNEQQEPAPAPMQKADEPIASTSRVEGANDSENGNNETKV